MKEKLQSSDIYWFAGVLLAFLISFYLRAVIPLRSVFVGSDVIFSSESDAWYHMMLAITTALNLQLPWFDPMTYFPHGTPIPFGPFNSWGIALISLVAGLGHPSVHTIDTVGAFFPAVLGALLVIPVFFIGREIGGKSCGLISALIVAVIPGQVFERSVLGFTDHHASESLLSAFAIMFFMLAISSGKDLSFESIKRDWAMLKMPLLYSALAGASLGLYIDAWASGFLFEGIILIFIALQSISDHLKNRNAEYLGITGAITFLIAALLVLPFIQPFYGFSNYYYSLFQPTILLLGMAAALLVSFLSRAMREKEINRYYFPGTLAVIAALGLIILSVAMPSFTGTLLSGLNIFQPKVGGASTVAEASPLLMEGGQFSLDGIQGNFPGISVILSPFFLSAVALVLLSIYYIKTQKNTYLLMITWSVITLLLTLAQVRFAYYYGINVALLTGFLASWILLGTGSSKLKDIASESRDPAKLLISNLKGIAVIILILVLVIYPSVSVSILIAQYTTGGPDKDWMSSVKWLENNTPSPGMDIYTIYQRPPDNQQYSYPEAAYGVMSWWDYGHYIETIGHRMPNANPFQQGIGNLSANIPGSSPFFLSESEDQAESVLANLDKNRSPYLNTRYVMIDWEMATSKFYAMTAWSAVPITRYYGIFYQPQGNQLVPIEAYRDPFFETMTARLFFFDGSETPVGNAFAIAYQIFEQNGTLFPVIVSQPLLSSNYSELVNYVNESRDKGYESEIVTENNPTSISSSVPLAALKHYRLVHESESTVTYTGQKFVKTFEHVPGAVIRGKAPAGTKVTISVPIATNQNREFTYSQSNTTDASGNFTLQVPYSTQGPSASGTKFDTGPSRSYYELMADGKVYQVSVPEEAVMAGGTINV
ncbi:MAG: oligosaccharyl transferase, archaeosortase A system-associated [Methanotrichaceae archaeon]